jgi:hypothetical protein
MRIISVHSAIDLVPSRLSMDVPTAMLGS